MTDQHAQLTGEIGLVSNVTRYGSDGSVLEQVRANYTRRRCDGQWKVVLSFPLLEDGFGSGTPVAPG